MATIKREILEVTCDICGSESSPDEHKIYVKVNEGDGRDVGPAYVYGSVSFTQPYGVSGGDVCTSCKVKYLEQYLSGIKGETND